MEKFRKVYRIGMGKTCGGRGYSIFVETEYNGKTLSIHGVEGPLSSGNCLGSCGQIDMHLDVNKITPAPGWTRNKIRRLLEIWGKWHLNDMRSGCEHQRAEHWGEKSVSEKHTGHVRETEHPEGVLCKPCPVCGYKYGSAWLHEEVPDDVLQELKDFPDTDIQPAWV